MRTTLTGFLLCMTLTVISRAGLLPPFPAGSAATAEPAPPAATLREKKDDKLVRKLAAQVSKKFPVSVRPSSSSVPLRSEAKRPTLAPGRPLVDLPRPVIPSEGIIASAEPQLVHLPDALPLLHTPVPVLNTTPFTPAAQLESGPSTALIPSLDASDFIAPGEPLPLSEDPAAPAEYPSETPSETLAPESIAETEIPREELVREPARSEEPIEGPLFRVSGTDAITFTQSIGYRFTPAGGAGRRDGVHTVASQFRGFLSSEVHGPYMSQVRPPIAWSINELSNTFFMFCDDRYNATPLAPGWRIRGIRLTGPHWDWVACPRSGGRTASFSVKIIAYRNPRLPDSSVELAGLTLEGPAGATDWRAAFPSLIRKKAPAPTPSLPDQNINLPTQFAVAGN